MRPALRVASASCRSKRENSMRSRRSSCPFTSSVSCFIGRRFSFQRPGAALASSSIAFSGLPWPPPVTSARPLSRVTGALAIRADRSSASVCRFSPASGQACSGRSAARRSTLGAAPAVAVPAMFRPRKVPLSRRSSTLPSAFSTAAQRGLSPSSVGRTAALASSLNGALLATRSAPSMLTPKPSAASLSARCWAPGSALSTSLSSASLKSGSSVLMRTSCTRTWSRSSWTGVAMLCGKVSGWPLGGPVLTVSLPATTRSARNATQAWALGRHFHIKPSAARSSISSHWRPLSHSTRKLSARHWPPSKAPLKPFTWTIGSRCSSHSVPASLASSQRPPPASSPRTSISSATTAASGSSSASVVRTGRGRAWGGVAAGWFSITR